MLSLSGICVPYIVTLTFYVCPLGLRCRFQRLQDFLLARLCYVVGRRSSVSTDVSVFGEEDVSVMMCLCA